MMKKLLAITLVLGIAAAASAVTVTPSDSSFEVAKGDTLQIVISNDSEGAYDFYLALTGVPETDLTVTSPGNIGALGELQDPATTGWAGYWYLVVAGAPGTIIPGDPQFVLDYTAGDETSMATIEFQDSSTWAPFNTITIQNTPEPMTLGLLGLGGLFLRRRK